MRILVVDDHLLFAEVLASSLRSTHIVDVACDAEAALRSLAMTPFDLVLLDLALPTRNGFALWVDIREHFPRTACLVITMHDHPSARALSRDLGISGFLGKTVSTSDLLAAIATVESGGTWFPEGSSAQSMVVSQLDPDTRITPRQYQVLGYLAHGLTYSEIARVLNVSEDTVDFHLRHLRERLGARSNADLTRRAIEHGMLGPVLGGTDWGVSARALNPLDKASSRRQ